MSSDDGLFTCPDCGARLEPETCRLCEGTGLYMPVYENYWVLCPACEGDGYLVFCDACDLKENKALSRKCDTDV